MQFIRVTTSYHTNCKLRHVMCHRKLIILMETESQDGKVVQLIELTSKNVTKTCCISLTALKKKKNSKGICHHFPFRGTRQPTHFPVTRAACLSLCCILFKVPIEANPPFFVFREGTLSFLTTTLPFKRTLSQ